MINTMTLVGNENGKYKHLVLMILMMTSDGNIDDDNYYWPASDDILFWYISDV